MSKVTKTIFGDGGKGAQKAQTRENQANQEFVERQIERARGEAIPLFGQAQESRRAGTQAALDIFGQTIPEQARVFQQGNFAAQNAVLSGGQEQRNAILGIPNNPGALAAQRFRPDLSFAQQQLPDVQTPQETLAPPTPEPQQQSPLSGFFGGGFNAGGGGNRGFNFGGGGGGGFNFGGGFQPGRFPRRR